MIGDDSGTSGAARSADRGESGNSISNKDRPTLLDEVRSVLAVVAHPDDESFGLGAILHRLTGAGAAAAVLCFTHGEASTLHGVAGDLYRIRAEELAEAGAVLGIGRTELLTYPDGALQRAPAAELSGHVLRMAREVGAGHLLVFDPGGITGHPDHVRATEVALAAAEELDLAVLAWALPAEVAGALNREFGTGFTGYTGEQAGERLTVERAGQWRAIACHRSQAAGNRVLSRRLELLGDSEQVRLLRCGRGPHRSGA